MRNEASSKVSKKSKRTPNQGPQDHMAIERVHPLTSSQTAAFRAFDEFQVISLDGYPGTGKTFLAMYMALKEIEGSATYHKVVIVRSSVSSREIGFQPGNTIEKMKAFETPYEATCAKLYGRGDAYSILKRKGRIEFEPTSFLRGNTFENCIVIVDEAQNMAANELHTINTRVGETCKVVFCGDFGQDDLTNPRYRERSGYREMLELWKSIPACSVVSFGIADIVRSGYVKQYIIAQAAAKSQGVSQLLVE